MDQLPTDQPPENQPSEPLDPLQPVEENRSTTRMTPNPAPPRKSRSWILVLILLMLMFFLFGSVLVNFALIASNFSADPASRVTEELFSIDEYRKGKGKVAIISVEGTILTGEGFVKRQIDQAKRDKDVKAIVLRVNSPGGTVTGSDYMYHHLKNLAEEREIPIVVSMGGLAASGGYYVSMASGHTKDSIFAEPTTWTGSIGVIIPHYNLGELLREWGIEEDSVASHKLKNMGSLARSMTDEERQIFQALVDDSFSRFKSIVRDGREDFSKDPQALDKLATGQIFTADQALENGLIDKIGFIEDAIERAIELANLDQDDVKVVRYKREPTMADLLFGGSVRSPSVDLAAILDQTSPRAYYLCTQLPPLVRGKP